jgi:hypothetical protein
MNNSKKDIQHKLSFWGNPRYWLYRQWAKLFSFFMENFNPKWREPLPPVPCQICGQIAHKTNTCPKAKEMGF